MCRSISGVTDNTEDFFGFLQILACAQETALAQMGGISIRELLQLMGSQQFSLDQTYDEWLYWRYEGSGTHQRQLPVQRALAYFLENNILLTHSENGYLFKNRNVSAYLSEAAPDDVKERIWEYIASVFWYLPDPACVWDELLRTERFHLCLSCLEYVRLDSRFVDELLDYVKRINNREAIWGRLEKFLSWMVEYSAEEAYILFVLELVLKLYDYLSVSEDDEESDEFYQAFVVPLYQRIHNQIYEKNCGSLSVPQQYLLQYLYDLYAAELQDPPAAMLTPQQTEELEILQDAVFTLFFPPEDYEKEEEYSDMVSILCGSIDKFIGFLRMNLVRGNPLWHRLDESLAQLVLRDGLLSEEILLRIMTEVLHVHLGGDAIWDAINNTQISLIQPAHELGENAFGVSVLHILYDAICVETRLRRCEWVRWTTYLFSELINEIYSATKDDVVGKIVDMLPGVIYDELTDIDEDYQNWVNWKRSEHRRSCI